ncbi:MAG: CBS domain-containing protein [Halieaceae bacterium]|jgi:CBS domain-containing membrane protein|nr:CBS domain-containing protein [Halieaceae bacterium]
MFTVADIMTTELYTLTPEDSLQEARELMARHHIRHLPIVTSEEELVGLVTHRDILAAADSTVLASPEARGAVENLIALSTVMTEVVSTVDEGAHLRGVALYLQKHKVGCLPVLRDGSLVGIITDSDFVSVAINLMEQMEDSEPFEYD